MGVSLAISSPLCCCYNNASPPHKGGLLQKLKVNLKISGVYNYSKAKPRSYIGCKPEGVDFADRTSPAEVKKEIEQCYELIQRLGRGVVYFGSSRLRPNHPHYAQSFELGKDIANLLSCTSWSGAGPGLMDAVTKGALEAGKLLVDSR